LMRHRDIVAVRLQPLYGEPLPMAGRRLRNDDLDRQHVLGGYVLLGFPTMRNERLAENTYIGVTRKTGFLLFRHDFRLAIPKRLWSSARTAMQRKISGFGIYQDSNNRGDRS
ncbi:hypothetical protein, partial [Mesorhizobium sp.]